MARKSRVGNAVVDKSSINNGVYRTGVYVRLSSEDKDEDTIENQLYLLKSYVDSQSDMRLEDSYIDNGYSGTNFDRPQFMRLMEDIKSDRINCIVVKDLSRLGRNYIETGNYIENVFPFLNVRFVSVTDAFDTLNGAGVESMVASFKNLVNDVYAKDISRKIISAFRTKQKNGEFIGLVAPYGYLKSKENKNRFVVDEETAPTVRRIFDLYADGKGFDYIARELNKEGMDSPRKYRYKIGVTKSDRYKESVWGRTVIKTILTNRAYIGDMVQCKTRQELCNNVSREYVDSKEWIVAEATHEPIVDKDVFYKVQEILEQRSRLQAERKANSNIKKEDNLLRGYLRCGCCGSSFNLSQIMRNKKTERNYYCSGYKCLRESYCSNKYRINKQTLEQTVYQTIQGRIMQLLNVNQLREPAKMLSLETDEKRMSEIAREIRKLSGKMADLYKDTADGLLDDSDYLMIKTEYSNQIEKLEEEKKHLSSAIEKEKKKANSKSVAVILKEYRRQGKLTREMVNAFVSDIKIYDRETIEINLKGNDQIIEVLEGDNE